VGDLGPSTSEKRAHFGKSVSNAHSPTPRIHPDHGRHAVELPIYLHVLL